MANEQFDNAVMKSLHLYEAGRLDEAQAVLDAAVVALEVARARENLSFLDADRRAAPFE